MQSKAIITAMMMFIFVFMFFLSFVYDSMLAQALKKVNTFW